MKRSRSYYAGLAWTEACKSARAWVERKKLELDQSAELHQPAPAWGVWLLTAFILAGLIWVACALTLF